MAIEDDAAGPLPGSSGTALPIGGCAGNVLVGISAAPFCGTVVVAGASVNGMSGERMSDMQADIGSSNSDGILIAGAKGPDRLPAIGNGALAKALSSACSAASAPGGGVLFCRRADRWRPNPPPDGSISTPGGGTSGPSKLPAHPALLSENWELAKLARHAFAE